MNFYTLPHQECTKISSLVPSARREEIRTFPWGEVFIIPPLPTVEVWYIFSLFGIF